MQGHGRAYAAAQFACERKRSATAREQMQVHVHVRYASACARRAADLHHNIQVNTHVQT